MKTAVHNAALHRDSNVQAREQISEKCRMLTLCCTLLGDRQSSHPVKNLASVLWQVFRGVAYPGFRDNRSTLNTKTG